MYLLCGYADGYQVWDVTKQEVREIASKLDKPLGHLALFPRKKLGLVAVRRASTREVRVYDLEQNDSVWLLRLLAPVTALEATASTLVVESQGQVDVYDSESYAKRFSVQTCGTPNVFALGPRWLA